MKIAICMFWKIVQCGSSWTVPGKVDVDLKCDICSVSGNIQESFRSHGVIYQENYAEGEILETFAPALPI